MLIEFSEIKNNHLQFSMLSWNIQESRRENNIRKISFPADRLGILHFLTLLNTFNLNSCQTIRK